MSIEMGIDRDLVRKITADIANALDRSDPGVSIRVRVAGSAPGDAASGLPPVTEDRARHSAFAVQELVSRLGNRVRVMKHGTEFVAVMKTHDVYQNFGEERARALEADHHIVGVDQIGDLNPETLSDTLRASEGVADGKIDIKVTGDEGFLRRVSRIFTGR